MLQQTARTMYGNQTKQNSFAVRESCFPAIFWQEIETVILCLLAKKFAIPYNQVYAAKKDLYCHVLQPLWLTEEKIQHTVE